MWTILIFYFYADNLKAPHGYLMNSFPKKVTNLLFTVIVYIISFRISVFSVISIAYTMYCNIYDLSYCNVSRFI